MIDFDTTDPKLLRVTITGDISRQEVKDFYAKFKPEIDARHRTGVLVDITGFQDITPGAMLEDVIEEFGLLGDMSKMPRVAMITGNRTWAGMVRYLNPIIPKMETRVFMPSEVKDAEDWARDLPEPKHRKPGLSVIETDHPDVLGFELDGYMDDDDMDIIVRPFRDRINEGGQFNALARLKHFAGFDPEILFDRALLGMKWDAIRALHRYAIVTDHQWVRPFAGMARLVSKVDVKIFPLAEEQAAWDWVKEPIPNPA